MPALEAFPKSHVVTFQYYRGVIQFLEEDYQNVRYRCGILCWNHTDIRLGGEDPRFGLHLDSTVFSP